MSECPNCKRKLDAQTCVTEEGATPNAGDIAICFYCGEINQYDDDLNLEVLPTSKLKRIKLENPEDYEVIMDAVIMVKSRIRNQNIDD